MVSVDISDNNNNRNILMGCSNTVTARTSFLEDWCTSDKMTFLGRTILTRCELTKIIQQRGLRTRMKLNACPRNITKDLFMRLNSVKLNFQQLRGFFTEPRKNHNVNKCRHFQWIICKEQQILSYFFSFRNNFFLFLFLKSFHTD
jgi:hypothetical protein